MKIEIDPETRDRIVAATIREDIKNIKSDIKNERLYIGEDVKNWKRYLAAMKTLQEWYGK